MGALTVWTGKTPEAALTRARNERTAAESRIAGYEVRRQTELLQADTVADIDLIDQAIAADRRAILICDQRIAVIERDLRQQNRNRREADRTAALKILGALYAKRTAKSRELGAALDRVVAIAQEIKDTAPYEKAWPFHDWLPNFFTWRHDFNRDLMEAVRTAFGDLMPGNVKQAIGYRTWGGGDGVVQALPAGPRPPDDMPGKLAAHAKHILESLRRLKINEPEADDGAENVASSENVA